MVQKKHQDHQRILAEMVVGLMSSFVLRCNQLGLTFRIFFPEHNDCPCSRIKCGAEEVELGYKTNPHANGLERVFQRSTQATDSPLAAKMSKLPPKCPGESYSTGIAFSAKNDVDGLPHAVNNPLQLPMDSREETNFP